MGWPQVVYILLLGISLGASIIKDGKPKTGTHNLFHDLIAYALGVTLMYCGGFFG